MQRREFLKLMSAVPAVLAIPSLGKSEPTMKQEPVVMDFYLNGFIRVYHYKGLLDGEEQMIELFYDLELRKCFKHEHGVELLEEELKRGIRYFNTEGLFIVETGLVNEQSRERVIQDKYALYIPRGSRTQSLGFVGMYLDPAGVWVQGPKHSPTIRWELSTDADHRKLIETGYFFQRYMGMLGLPL